MLFSQALSQPGQTLDRPALQAALAQGLAGRFTGARLLVLIPDGTRSLPLAELFHPLVEALAGAQRVDFLVALGTHPPLDPAGLNRLVGLSDEERQTTYKHVGLANHAWEDPAALTNLGWIETDELKALAGDFWHPSLPERIQVRINRAALAYDHILIFGPVLPHEVAGFSGGSKYLFPGISGPEMIHASHWLGALTGVVRTIGFKDTPVRRLIEAAARRLSTPLTLAAAVLDGHGLAGLFIGEVQEAWNAAADLSAQRNVVWSERPFQRALSCAPAMYDELWTAAKAMYKLEPAMAEGGEVVIYAPHLETVSRTHGRYIYQVGYHSLPYFLNDWERFKDIPLGVLAHSTHLRGAGRWVDGVEKPNIQVILASRIPPEDCARLNLGYLDPAQVRPEDWQGREGEGVLYVPRAGETLYRINP